MSDELKPGTLVYYLRQTNTHRQERKPCTKVVYEVLWHSKQRVACRVAGREDMPAKGLKREHLIRVEEVK